MPAGKAPDKKGFRGQFKDNFSYFSMKTYVVTPNYNELFKTVLTWGQNLCVM